MKKRDIVARPAPVSCATRFGDNTLICRRDGSIEAHQSLGKSSAKFPYEIIALTYLSGNRFAGLDIDGTLRAFNVSSTSGVIVVETIKPDPSIRPIMNRSNPGTGITEIEYGGDVCLVGTRIFFRMNRIVVNMTIDGHNSLRKRWYSPLMLIEQDNEFSVPVACVPDDKILAGISSTPELVFLALFPSTPPQTIHEMCMHLTTITPSTGTMIDSFEIPNVVLENFSRIAVSGNFLFLQTIDCTVRVIEICPGGMRLHSMVSLPSANMISSVPPPSVKRLNSLPPLPVAEPSMSFFPRYNPQLNVLRKHSQPMAYSSISDTVLNLSLGSRDEHKAPLRGALCTLRDAICPPRPSLFLGDELLVSDGDGKILSLTLDRPPFSYSLHAAPDSWVVDWSKQEKIQGVLFGSEKNSSVAMSDDKLRFIFSDAVQARVDLVIQIVGATCPYTNLIVDQKEEDICVESLWERRSLAIVPGSHSVVSFDGVDGEDTSPRAKQRTCGFSVVDAGVTPSPSSCSVCDTTCEFQLCNGLKIFGNFDGDLILASDRILAQIPVSHGYSIKSVVGDLRGDRILAGDRGGALYELFFDQAADEPLWLLHRYEIGVFGVSLQRIEADRVLMHSGDKVWIVSIKSEKNLAMREIHLGYSRPIRSVVAVHGDSGNFFALTEDGKHVLRIAIDMTSTSAEYSVNLPFESATNSAHTENKLFIIGTIPRLNQRALLEVELKPYLVGAIESPDSVSLTTVLPFDSLKEEPICVGIWKQEKFPEGLVVVGTHGKSRGRVIIFDRTNMTPVCKTSVPSKQVSVVEALSSTTMALGCTDCVVLIGLTTGDDDQITLVTLGVYQTYTLVRNINRVSDARFLIVQSNGIVVLLEHKGDSLLQVATLESQRNIVSPCVVLPEGRFICSSIEGDLLEYSMCNVDTSGVMMLQSEAKIGDTLFRFRSGIDGMIVATANGSIFQVST